MRLPRQDTHLRLSAESPREALLGDEALLERVADSGGELLVRWWIAAGRAVVAGLGLRHRLAEVVDLERCREQRVEVLERRAGGGAVLVDEGMICGAICVPRSLSDVTESYRWLGDTLADRLRGLGIDARRVEVEEARADVATLRARADAVSRLMLGACYGALSPHEVLVGKAKIVGLAQVRRAYASLFQFGVLLHDQSALADYLVVPDESTREQLRGELHSRTVGLDAFTDLSASAAVAAIADARPFVP